ncbi:glycosyltransferase, partial [Ferrimicrobium sp.]
MDEIEFLHKLLDNRTIERDDLAHQLTTRSAQLDEILNSTSWRITKGVRQLSTTLRNDVAPRVVEELRQRPRLLPLVDRLRPGISERLAAPPTPPLHADAERLEIVNGPYLEWVQRFDTDIDEAAIRSYLATLKHQPIISVILPTYNSPIVYLREAIESVRSQIYANWQLCIVDDGSITPEVHEVINEY